MLKAWKTHDLELPFAATGGLLLSLFFVCGTYLPRNAAVVTLFTVAGWGLLTVCASRWAILERLMIVLYVLPFSVTIGYLFDPDFVWGFRPNRVKLMTDQVLITEMLTMGLVGLFGLLTGMKLLEVRRCRFHPALRRSHPRQWAARATCVAQDSTDMLYTADTLDGGASRKGCALDGALFLFLLLISLTLSYGANGASPTIFTAAYRGTSGWTVDAGFAGAGFACYLICILLFIDAQRDAPSRRRQKMTLLLSVTVSATLFIELIRGNRDSIGLIVALMALYVTDSTIPSARRTCAVGKEKTNRFRRLVLLGFGVVTVYAMLTPLRTRLAGSAAAVASLSWRDIVIGVLIESTWTFVLLTNLGLAGFYRAGTIDYLCGATYLDYLLSLPPGPIARAIGYTRPLEHFQGPNWWFVGIGSGGIHPVAVPFMNFGIFGVFFVLLLFGAFIAWADHPNGSVWRRFLYAGIIVGSFKWFWYGDMTVIRVLMGVCGLYVVYIIGLNLSRLLMMRRVGLRLEGARV